jgi:hypothetical protein
VPQFIKIILPPELFRKIFPCAATYLWRLSPSPDETAISQQVGIILLVAITVILAALVALIFHFPDFNFQELKTPSFIEITGVYHKDESGRLTFDSRVILLHNGTYPLENDLLRAEFFRNGMKIAASIETMNGYKFVSTHHFGVQTMGGLGCSGATWEPKEKITLDFSDNTFHPGEILQVDIFMKKSGSLVSRYTYHA